MNKEADFYLCKGNILLLNHMMGRIDWSDSYDAIEEEFLRFFKKQFVNIGDCIPEYRWKQFIMAFDRPERGRAEQFAELVLKYKLLKRVKKTVGYCFELTFKGKICMDNQCFGFRKRQFPKCIILSGSNKSGKTTILKLLSKKLGLTAIYEGKTGCVFCGDFAHDNIAIITQNDCENAIKIHIEKLKDYKCDYIICASCTGEKTLGTLYRLVAQKLNISITQFIVSFKSKESTCEYDEKASEQMKKFVETVFNKEGWF